MEERAVSDMLDDVVTCGCGKLMKLRYAYKPASESGGLRCGACAGFKAKKLGLLNERGKRALTAEDAEGIATSKRSTRDLAADYGVSVSVINRIRSGKAYNYARGAARGGSKLTVQQVREIRKREAPQRKLAERFCVSKNTISQIQRGVTWANIPTTSS